MWHRVITCASRAGASMVARSNLLPRVHVPRAVRTVGMGSVGGMGSVRCKWALKNPMAPPEEQMTEVEQQEHVLTSQMFPDYKMDEEDAKMVNKHVVEQLEILEDLRRTPTSMLSFRDTAIAKNNEPRYPRGLYERILLFLEGDDEKIHTWDEFNFIEEEEEEEEEESDDQLLERLEDEQRRRDAGEDVDEMNKHMREEKLKKKAGEKVDAAKTILDNALVLDFTGSDQVVVEMSHFFKNVTAVVHPDNFEELAGSVDTPKNVKYIKSDTPANLDFIEDDSYSLVMVPHSLHCMTEEQRDEVLEETRRVVKEGGCVAAWGYGLPTLRHPVVNNDNRWRKVQRHLVKQIEKAKDVDMMRNSERYEDLDLPFEVSTEMDVRMEHSMNLTNILKYINAWPDRVTDEEEGGDEEDKVVPLNLRRLESEIIHYSGCKDRNANIRVTWPLKVALGRKESAFFLDDDEMGGKNGGIEIEVESVSEEQMEEWAKHAPKQ